MKTVSMKVVVGGALVAFIGLFAFLWWQLDESVTPINKTDTDSSETESQIFTPANVFITEVASGFGVPTDIASNGTPDDPRLFVVERSGTIQVLDGETLSDTPFLDLGSQVLDEGEQGLLGLAFHPEFADNNLFYVNAVIPSNDSASRSVILEFAANEDGLTADLGSQREVLRYDQPFGNHNGGDLVFDEAGNLYIAVGDGGNAKGDDGDTENNAQDTSTLLGSILRINPLQNGDQSYSIPDDNPFIGDPTARPEIWAYGLRNPWRISFDSETDILFIADVGKKGAEEVNVLSAENSGANFGWQCYEGTNEFKPDNCADGEKFTDPYISYEHEGDECSGSITGGFVYRGSDYEALYGQYVYADFCKGRVYVGATNGSGESALVVEGIERITTFGESNSGELYVGQTTDDGGVIYKVEAL